MPMRRISKWSFTSEASVLPISAIFWPFVTFSPSLTRISTTLPELFAFMEEHYTDPFMNWEGSDERASVEALGFALPSLDPIIEAWFRRL